MGLLLFTLTLTVFPQVLHAEGGTGEIRLHSGFLKGVKFTRGDEAPRPVYGFAGLSLHSGFADVLSEHPPALRCAHRAVIWNGVGTIGLLGVVGSTLAIFLDTLQEADDVSSGKTVDDSPNWGPVGVLAASGVVFLAGSIGSGSEMKHGIALFNEHARQNSDGTREIYPDSTPAGTRLTPYLGTLPGAPCPIPRASVGLGCAAGLTLRLE